MGQYVYVLSYGPKEKWSFHSCFHRYGAEMPIVMMQAVFYLGIMAVARLARPNISKLCYRREDKSVFFVQTGFKMIAIWSILAAYIIPFFLIPHTIHPLIGWSLYLLGAFSLSCIAVNAFLLPMIPVLVPWVGILGTLLVMAYPWYNDGVIRALSVFGYAFCCSPVLCLAFVKIMSSLHLSLEREAFLPRLAESASPAGNNKLYWAYNLFHLFWLWRREFIHQILMWILWIVMRISDHVLWSGALKIKRDYILHWGNFIYVLIIDFIHSFSSVKFF